MKELVILSGKGGTGKTAVAASLAYAQASVVAADCDLDAPNLHLLLQATAVARTPLTTMKAFVDSGSCKGCGTCARQCRFRAIEMRGKGKGRRAIVDADRCEGCDLCRRLCPERAIELREQVAGEQLLSRTGNGWLVHGWLEPPAENVGRFASRIKADARAKASEERCPLVIVDGPPGIGCPAIATLSGADLCLLVTEPTVSGLHDLERAWSLARRMHIPSVVALNRCDLNPAKADEIEARAEAWGLPLLGRLPFDEAVPSSVARGRPVTELFPECAFSKGLQGLWRALRTEMGL